MNRRAFLASIAAALVIAVFAVAQDTGPIPPRVLAKDLYRCGAIDGNIGMLQVLLRAVDLPAKPSWNRALQRLENDRRDAHCEQYMKEYSVERGYWRFTP